MSHVSLCISAVTIAVGDADYDLAAGVAFEDLPEDFVCPLCGVDKSLFEQQE